MNRLNQYIVFGLLVVFSFQLLPASLFQQQLLQHIQAIQHTDQHHQCEFDQLLCNSQLLKHDCDHKGHIAAKTTTKQHVFVQILSASIVEGVMVQLQGQIYVQLLTRYFFHFSSKSHLANLQRGPPKQHT